MPPMIKWRVKRFQVAIEHVSILQKSLLGGGVIVITSY